MKHTMYFETKEDYDRYWNGQEPSSNYLCVIKKVELPTGDVITNSAVTTTNNIDQGETVDIGTSCITYAYATSYEYDEATEKSEIITVGYVVSQINEE